MKISLSQAVAPATEPLSIDDVLWHCQIDAGNQEPAPSAISVALASPAVAGNVDNGVHRYLATFVTAVGETQAGEVSAAVTVGDKAVSGQVALAAIPIGGDLVTSRKLYRTEAGGSVYLLLATIADNTTTAYADNVADANLGAAVPARNTTADPHLTRLIVAARVTAERITRRALVTQTWALYLPMFPGWEIAIPKPPLQSVSSISYVDADGVTQTLATDQYLVDARSEPACIVPAYGLVWPVTRVQPNAVTVRFVCGYGAAAAVPAGIKNWMLMRIATLWRNRAALSIGQGIVQAELSTSFVDGLLDDFVALDYGWAMDD